jgi:hypothetical protein
MSEEDYRIDLGWANGWKERPVILDKCEKLEHDVGYEKGPWNCTHRHFCDICSYEYWVDSSG